MSGNPLLVVAAVPQELAAFQHRGREGAVRALITGIGRERAYHRVRAQLQRSPCRGVVATGYAGGAVAGLQVGELLVADEVMEARSQRLFRPTLPGPSASLPMRRGRLLTVERPAWTTRAKECLGRRFRALGLDMESAAVAQAAQEAGIGWMAVRVVLDPLEEPLFSTTMFRRMAIAGRQLAAYLEQVKGAC